MASSANKKLTNTLTITSEQMDQYGIEDKLLRLFGNIYEEYEMPEWEFHESLIED